MAQELTQIRDITLDHFNSKMEIIIEYKNNTIDRLVEIEKTVVSFKLVVS